MICTQLNPYACRTYLVGRSGTNEVVLIDPVLDHLGDYLSLLRLNDFALTHVVDTHTHSDHISGSAALTDVTGCEYIVHASSPCVCARFRVDDGFEWEILGGVPVRVLHTPGHAPDSICLVFPDRIFTGDTLFLDDGGAGRDDLPGGDSAAHWESLARLAALPDGLLVLPAHDYRGRAPSILGRQKKTNPCLQKASPKEYAEYATSLGAPSADWMKDVLKANYACARNPRAAWIPADASSYEGGGTRESGVNEIRVSSIPPQVLRQKMASSKPPVLVDVREEEELSGELGHIENVVHIPVGALAFRLAELDPHKGREIVTVCRSGARAGTAAQILAKAGFPRVSVLSGGMLSWNAMR